jgi:hypothetical protein
MNFETVMEKLEPTQLALPVASPTSDTVAPDSHVPLKVRFEELLTSGEE